jgi:hypothetical protein
VPGGNLAWILVANRHDGWHARFRVPPQQGQRLGAVGQIARGVTGLRRLRFI